MTRITFGLVACIVILAACSSTSFPRTAAGSDVVSTTTVPTPAEPTTVKAPPVTGAASTTTPSTAPGSVDEPSAIAGNAGLFDADHADIETSLRAQPDPRLAAFVFDTKDNLITADFTYATPATVTPADIDDFAWHVDQIVADTFWSPELVRAVEAEGVKPDWLPTFRVRLANTIYLCTPAVEIAASAHRISQSDWSKRCAA